MVAEYGCFALAKFVGIIDHTVVIKPTFITFIRLFSMKFNEKRKKAEE